MPLVDGAVRVAPGGVDVLLVGGDARDGACVLLGDGLLLEVGGPDPDAAVEATAAHGSLSGPSIYHIGWRR